MYESYTTAYTPPPVYTPPQPVVTAQTPEQIQASTKAAALYNSATTDLQNPSMDNRSIQGKYGMTRPELERAVKQLDDQVNNPRVMSSEQAETQEWDFTGGTKNNSRVNFSLIDSTDELKGLNHQQQQAETATRAGIAMNTYSILKKQGQDVSRIAVKRSSDDPQRYHVIIETPNGMGGTNQQKLEHVDPNRLDLLTKKMAAGTAKTTGESSADATPAMQRNYELSLTLNIFGPGSLFGVSGGMKARVASMSITAKSNGVDMIVVRGGADPVVPFAPEPLTVRYEGENIPENTTATYSDVTDENAGKLVEGTIADASAKYAASVNAGDPIESYEAKVDGDGNATAKTRTESGKELYYKGNINDEGGLKETDAPGAEGQKAPDGLFQKSYFQGGNEPLQSGGAQSAGGLTDAESRQNLLNLMRTITDAMRELGNKLEEMYQAAAEKAKAGDKKAQERRDAEKLAEKKAAEKRQAAAQQAKTLENKVATAVITDPAERENMELKALHQKQESRG